MKLMTWGEFKRHVDAHPAVHDALMIDSIHVLTLDDETRPPHVDVRAAGMIVEECSPC